MSDYNEFLTRKTAALPPVGLVDIPALHPALKPFQRDIVSWALRRGRAALFEGTGLGKTLQQLAWASAIADETDDRVILFAPLGVAYQTVEEAAKWNIDGVAYAKDQSAANSRIVVTNYDRRGNFDIGSFSGIVLDESSIIKSDGSATRTELIEAAQKVLYRLCCTATPAPNDWTELGNHSEFLGVLSAKEMLSMYFVHEGAIRAGGPDAEEWRLKRHATRDFWKWVASWAVMIRDPNEFGYAEPGYKLPPLTMEQITVAADYAPSSDSLFPMEARTLGERIGVRRDTVTDRVKAAADIVNANPDKPWLIWCNLNSESDALEAAIPGAVQVQGSDAPSVKESRLIGFAHGKPNILITKPKIGGFGMNWQHCSDMIFVGLNDSFEQLFQSLRRCWRFGQTKPVTAYLIASELEGAVVANLHAKEAKYDKMSAAMAEQMQEFCADELKVHRSSGRVIREANKQMEIPSWL